MFFAEAGTDVVCTSRTQVEIEATAKEIKSMGRRSVWCIDQEKEVIELMF